jgi:hypothetical protein
MLLGLVSSRSARARAISSAIAVASDAAATSGRWISTRNGCLASHKTGSLVLERTLGRSPNRVTPDG